MILLFILLYFISIIILVCDKEYKDYRERYPSEILILAYAFISLSLLPVPVFVAQKLVDAFNWLRTEIMMRKIRRKVNGILKEKGIKERI